MKNSPVMHPTLDGLSFVYPSFHGRIDRSGAPELTGALDVRKISYPAPLDQIKPPYYIDMWPCADGQVILAVYEKRFPFAYNHGFYQFDGEKLTLLFDLKGEYVCRSIFFDGEQFLVILQTDDAFYELVSLTTEQRVRLLHRIPMTHNYFQAPSFHYDGQDLGLMYALRVPEDETLSRYAYDQLHGEGLYAFWETTETYASQFTAENHLPRLSPPTRAIEFPSMTAFLSKESNRYHLHIIEKGEHRRVALPDNGVFHGVRALGKQFIIDTDTSTEKIRTSPILHTRYTYDPVEDHLRPWPIDDGYTGLGRGILWNESSLISYAKSAKKAGQRVAAVLSEQQEFELELPMDPIDFYRKDKQSFWVEEDGEGDQQGLWLVTVKP